MFSELRIEDRINQEAIVIGNEAEDIGKQDNKRINIVSLLMNNGHCWVPSISMPFDSKLVGWEEGVVFKKELEQERELFDKTFDKSQTYYVFCNVVMDAGYKVVAVYQGVDVSYAWHEAPNVKKLFSSFGDKEGFIEDNAQKFEEILKNLYYSSLDN